MPSPATPEQVARTLRHLGGFAATYELRAAHRRPDVDKALDAGLIIRVRRGVYGVPQVADLRGTATRLAGIATLHSAAAHWNWKMQWTPTEPSIAVIRGRKLTVEQTTGIRVSWRAIQADDVVDGWVTSRERTVLDCAAALPFPEALAIADSALRSRRVDRDELLERAHRLALRGPRNRILRVLEAATPDAAGPFESVLRAIVDDIPGACFRPQVRIDDCSGFVGRVDLADERLRMGLAGEHDAAWADAVPAILGPSGFTPSMGNPPKAACL